MNHLVDTHPLMQSEGSWATIIPWGTTQCTQLAGYYVTRAVVKWNKMVRKTHHRIIANALQHCPGSRKHQTAAAIQHRAEYQFSYQIVKNCTALCKLTLCNICTNNKMLNLSIHDQNCYHCSSGVYILWRFVENGTTVDMLPLLFGHCACPRLSREHASITVLLQLRLKVWVKLFRFNLLPRKQSNHTVK